MSELLSTDGVKAVIIKSVRNDQTITSNAKSKIIRVIRGYGKREGVIDRLFGVIYRILNAVKAIFGQSDWQRAVKSFPSTEIPSPVNQLPVNKKKKLLKIREEMDVKKGNWTLSIYVNLTYEKEINCDGLHLLMDYDIYHVQDKLLTEWISRLESLGEGFESLIDQCKNKGQDFYP